MAEKIVSPGVFTTETDLSFLPAGIGEIGAVVIGPTKKGPAFHPTIIESIQEFDTVFGGIDSETYVPYTVQEYLRSAGRVTIIRLLGTEAFEPAHSFTLKVGGEVVSALVPKAGATGFEPVISGFGSSSEFVIADDTDATVFTSCSFNKTSDNYIEKVFGRDPFSTTAGSVVGKKYYLYRHFATTGSGRTLGTNDSVTTGSYSSTDGGVIGLTTNKSYAGGSTPIIQSQTVAGTKYDLFQFKTIGDGTDANYNIKVQIQDLKRAGTIAGSEYGAFTVVIRRVNGFNYKGDFGSLDTDNRPEIVETFPNCNLDPDSVNFVTRKIGDRYATCDDDGRITYSGDYPNKSKYVYVYHTDISDIENLPKELLPFGFKPLSSVISESGVPAPTYVTRQGDADTFNQKVAFGFDFTNTDNREHLWSIPDGASTVGTAFSLEDQFSHASSSLNGTDGLPFVTSSLSSSVAPQAMLKFIVPFQGGYDGIGYNVKRNIGKDITASNLYGMDLSSATGGGTKAYIKALNTISNADEYDINMISIPGVIHSVHPVVTNKAILVAEDRGDAFVVIDAVKYNEFTGKSAADNVANSSITNLDSNFAATYWPWVKILDTSTNKPTWVPPGVVLPGVIANTDKVAHEWFAPAGLNRGGLTQVLEAEVRLTHEERDTLYEKRINPIATFPGEGVCIWGQKTLQGKPSALDRVNVRRLLIRVKKFIASASRFLVFEQNNPALRQRFLNIANPFLESVQQNAGLSAFKVVMDETNNTPDVVDRNQLVGQIFLQPTRTAEFIVLDFTVLPTGATFPE